MHGLAASTEGGRGHTHVFPEDVCHSICRARCHQHIQEFLDQPILACTRTSQEKLVVHWLGCVT